MDLKTLKKKQKKKTMSDEKNWKTLRKPGELVKVWLLRNNVLGGGEGWLATFAQRVPQH